MTNTLSVDQAITKLAESYKIWVIGAGRKQPVLPQQAFREGSDHNYNLKGSPPRKYLQWEKQTFGINLGWTDDAEPATGRRASRWFFARQGNSTGPVRYGERIALGYGGSPSFVQDEERSVGINLGWSKAPVFEWTLLGGADGSAVDCGDRLAIHNTRAGSPRTPGVLIHFDRTVGGDIGWPDSQTWWDQAKDKLAGMAREAVTKLVMAKLSGC